MPQKLKHTKNIYVSGTDITINIKKKKKSLVNNQRKKEKCINLRKQNFSFDIVV